MSVIARGVPPYAVNMKRNVLRRFQIVHRPPRQNIHCKLMNRDIVGMALAYENRSVAEGAVANCLKLPA